nr:hypothetical protein [Nitrosomonas nitrosa]
MLKSYLETIQSKQLGISIFTEADHGQLCKSEPLLRQLQNHMFDVTQLPHAIDMLCSMNSNVFFDRVFQRDAWRIRELVRGRKKPPFSWLGVRWWNIDSVDQLGISSLCSAVHVKSVKLNLFMLSRSSADKPIFSYLGELLTNKPSWVEHLFVLDTTTSPNRNFRSFWESAVPYTYFSDDSRDKLMNYLAGRLAEATAL